MRKLIAFCLLGMLALAGVFAQELPVRTGLFLWMNAAEQAALREEAGWPGLGHLQPVDYLLGSGATGRRAAQLSAERRPVMVTDGEAAYLKFDGKDDFLGVGADGASAAEVTIFLLAAPKSNPGQFTGMFGTAAPGQNDYTSGINLDFGPGATTNLSVLNVEAAGDTGFRDMLVPGFFNAAERPFGDFHVFTVRSRVGKAGTEVFLDGFKGGDRDRSAGAISLDRMILGGRLYSNDPAQPPSAQGVFEGALAEVLVFDRALTDEERQAMEQHLLAKTTLLNGLLHGAKGHPLETVEDAPVVQMLVPGFTVEELPIRIGNLNNLRYRHDGKLVGLGYDGRIHLLSDTDGDGLEDRSEVFWDQNPLRGPIGMALTQAGDPRGDGVYVASKSKISLILDRDGDGRADEEQVIASGWPEGFQSVDTLGVAVDPKDGSVYFGLGCANFVDAYMIDPATGQAGYRLDDVRGTIQRLSPDYESYATVATGLRFTCALAFNRHGDLFATDQEGATWLPNGNPTDELLHIEPGKHYGFPPRHPKHLPDVRDEPPVMEYGPQHQSTVGLFFNEGVNGGPHFGPSYWAGDALVTGAARGKLWRTKLAKTPLGYIGQNHLIASLGLLAIDACVSPAGDLVVACHTGPPDWGTGPAGEGRIFRIRYTGQEVPQPVTAWAAGPDEFRIAFDRELDPAEWVDVLDQVKVEAGRPVGAGDRFEVIRPGYQVVRDQMAMPRRWVEVLGLSLTADRRTIVLRVARQTEPVNYAVTLPVPPSWRQPGGIEQHPQMDLLVTLNGLVASVQNRAGAALRTVLPHPSLQVSEEFTRGSAEHERFLKEAREGAWTIEGLVDISNPFVPAVQPGSRLDWDMSTDPFASAEFQVMTDHGGTREVEIRETAGKLGALGPMTISGADSSGNGLYLAHGELKHRLSPGRVYVPWASEQKAEKGADGAAVRTDVHGNWLRGRRLFLSEAGCATCHSVRGEGISFGPDLSNLVHRDRESVLQDIVHPAATINPDHAGTRVFTKDGTILEAVIRSANEETLLLEFPAGARLEVARAEVVKMEPMKQSIMPEGLADWLTPSEMEDLLTFLLTAPLEPAPITRTDPLPPPPRTLDDVRQVLRDVSFPAPETEPAPLRILLCAGPKDHGPDEHDYPLWQERWSKLFNIAPKVIVSRADGFPTEEQLAEADVAVFYNANPGWDEDKAAALDRFHERGGGAVYIHYAVDGGRHPAAAAERFGLASALGSKFRHGEMDLVFTQAEHPITRGFRTLHFTDETYWNLKGDVSRLEVLGTVVEEGEPRPELWTLQRGESRIVGCIPGHYTWTFDDPLFRVLVLRSICWAAGEENVDRLSELAVVGARLAR